MQKNNQKLRIGMVGAGSIVRARHLPAVTISALEAGKHVFCQARMSMDLAEAEEMLAASKRYPELVTMLCPPPMGMRGDLLVKKLLAENYIGHPHHVRLQSFTSNYLDL